MDITITTRVPLGEYIEQSQNEMKELNSIIELCEMRILHLRGEADGKAAASWIIDGNTDNPVAKLNVLLSGIEDGDPEVLDSLPQPSLGGEFAGDKTLHDIIAEEFTFYPADKGIVGEWEEYGDAYEEGFHKGVNDEIERMYKAYTAA